MPVHPDWSAQPPSEQVLSRVDSNRLYRSLIFYVVRGGSRPEPLYFSSVFVRVREFRQSQSRVFSLRSFDSILSSAPCLVKFARTTVADSPLRCAMDSISFSTSSSVTSMFSAEPIRS